MTDAPNYLLDAVTSKVATAAGLSMEQVSPAVAYTDATSFLDDAGEIDPEKIVQFAGTLRAPTSSDTVVDPVLQALERNRGPVGRADVGAVANVRDEARARMEARPATGGTR